LDDSEIHKRRLREAIVHHVQRHPEVSDTARGIAQWWLPPTGFEQATDVIDDVLDELVQAGILSRRRLPDGGVVYAAARPDTPLRARD
jgi:hypothetical protein